MKSALEDRRSRKGSTMPADERAGDGGDPADHGEQERVEADQEHEVVGRDALRAACRTSRPRTRPSRRTSANTVTLVRMRLRPSVMHAAGLSFIAARRRPKRAASDGQHEDRHGREARRRGRRTWPCSPLEVEAEERRAVERERGAPVEHLGVVEQQALTEERERHGREREVDVAQTQGRQGDQRAERRRHDGGGERRRTANPERSTCPSWRRRSRRTCTGTARSARSSRRARPGTASPSPRRARCWR